MFSKHSNINQLYFNLKRNNEWIATNTENNQEETSVKLKWGSCKNKDPVQKLIWRLLKMFMVHPLAKNNMEVP